MKQFCLRLLIAGLFCALLAGTGSEPAYADSAEETLTYSDVQAEVCEDPSVLPDQNTLVEGYLEKALGDDNLFEDEDTLEGTDGTSDEGSSESSETASGASETASGADGSESSVLSSGVQTDSTESSFGTTAYNNLSGQNAVMYTYLKSAITKAAAGERTTTKFTIPTAKLLGKRTFTESELGITVYNEKTKAFANKTTIAAKAYALFTYTISKVNYALQCDCPYELYWYEKTTGLVAINPGLTISSAGGGKVTFAKYVTVYMSVSEDFRSQTETTPYRLYNSSGTLQGTYYYHLDQSATVLPQTAASRARSYVSACTALSDYQKLLAYKNYICGQVSYNSDTADQSYGNPWQLVYVFDGDDTTNVVCEGYSKAFQYLCDLTDWDNDLVSCISVSGYLSIDGNDDDAERHMWNIVHMPDGYNYLADITNSDAYTQGDDGSLFMSGTIAADTGITWVQYEGCSSYLTYLYNENTLGMFKKAQLRMSDHAYPCTEGHTVVDDAFVWASPSQNGKKAGTHCSVCGEIIKAQTIVYKPATITCSTLIYNGKLQTPTVTLKNSDGKTINSKYYTVTFPNSVKVGTYKLKITFYGSGDSSDSEGFSAYRFTGSMTTTYKIRPKGTYITSLKAGRGKLYIHWKRQSTQTSGYQIQYAANAAFTKRVHRITISGSSVTSKVLSNLRRNYTYYVRVRTYKIVNGSKLVSSWSAKKKLKTS